MAVPVREPIPSLGGTLLRYRPVTNVRLTGPAGSHLLDGFVDTGADDTVFSDGVSALLGIDLRGAPERDLTLAARPQPVRCRYAPVELRLTDGVSETFEWTAVIGFVAARLHYNLLGYAGFLQYFQADFDGEARVVTLTPKPSFPGKRI